MAGDDVATYEEDHAADAHHVGGGHEHDHESTGHDHGDEGHDPDHDGEQLGPVDWGAWGASLLGVGLGLVIALVMYLAISG